MPRLGVVGTLVWDTIHGPVGGEPVSDWGGIAYSLVAWEAAAPPGWSVLPIIKVGADLRVAADRFLADLDGVSSLEHVRTVTEPNNRVSLFYHDRSRRCERLTGGVPGWSAADLQPAALSCDALYVNFISGWEIDRPAAAAIGERFEGPAWCDVHSLILGVERDGTRAPRPLEDRAGWLRPFDLVQVNEDELDVLAPPARDRQSQLEELLKDGPDAVFLTTGSRGAEWAVRPETRWLPDDVAGTVGAETAPELSPARVPDPTGCGDVWGISCFAALLGGSAVREAVRSANRLAAVAAGEQGTAGLARALKGAARTATTLEVNEIV